MTQVVTDEEIREIKSLLPGDLEGVIVYTTAQINTKFAQTQTQDLTGSQVLDEITSDIEDDTPLLKDQKPTEKNIIIEFKSAQNKLLYQNYLHIEWVYSGMIVALNALNKKLCEENENEACANGQRKLEIKALKAEFEKTLTIVSYLTVLMRHFYSKQHPSKSQHKKIETDLNRFLPLHVTIAKQELWPAIQVGGGAEVSPALAQSNVALQNKTWLGEIWDNATSLRYFRTILFVNVNWFRLYIVRIGRFIKESAIIATVFNSAALFFKSVGIVFNYLSFLFYMPRLITNLVLMGKHTIAHPWMSEEQKALGWRVRRGMQWQRREFQVLNDAVWAANALTVFVVALSLASGLATPIGMILIGALYYFDIWNAARDLKRTEATRGEVMARFPKSSNLPESYRRGIENYYNMQVSAKQFNLKVTQALAVCMSSVLLVGVFALGFGLTILALPYVVVPLIVFAAAVLAVTSYQFYNRNKYSSAKCKIDLQDYNAEVCQVLAPPVKAEATVACMVEPKVSEQKAKQEAKQEAKEGVAIPVSHPDPRVGVVKPVQPHTPRIFRPIVVISSKPAAPKSWPQFKSCPNTRGEPPELVLPGLMIDNPTKPPVRSCRLACTTPTPATSGEFFPPSGILGNGANGANGVIDRAVGMLGAPLSPQISSTSRKPSIVVAALSPLLESNSAHVRL